MPKKEKENLSVPDLDQDKPESIDSEMNEIKDGIESDLDADFQAREEILDAREAELALREQVLRDAEESAKDIPPKGPPPKERKRRRYMCVKKCHSPIDLDHPETCKVYEPGERVTFYEDQKNQIPRHFKPIPNRSAEAEVIKEADQNIGIVIPGFINKLRKSEMEHR